MFEIAFTGAAFVAGAIASVAGFGIGSVLTPILSVQTGTRLAVAAVSIPHFLATLVRFVLLREHADKRVLIHFGIPSAAGGLTGALFHAVASNPVLSFVFAGLLMFSGATAMSGYADRMRFGPKAAWLAGALSGMLGGLVGNQGGIRSAALIGFGLDRHAFVATATATGLIVDAARMPVYFFTAGDELRSLTRLIALATLGVLMGTILGARVLRRIPESVFHRIVGAIVFALGVFMLQRAIVAH